ncbi:MAG: cytochrome C oxidase subunit IV family protein [candidate division Zixibacteria bacterium]|nr:cytochrome C oxidase subunit IV family protein [candidate division Zixibacteria bacterium]
MSEHAHSQPGHGSDATVHVVPFRILVAVWLALMVLTVVTVEVVYIDLGNLNLYLAMAIATVKGALVALYFMHLRYDRPFHAIVFVTALVFVLLFVSLVLTDSGQYQPNIDLRQEQLLGK